MKKRKEIIEKYGLDYTKLIPSLTEDHPKKLILISSIVLIISMIFIPKIFGNNILYLFTSIIPLYLTWFILDRLYKSNEKVFSSKIRNYENTINKEIESISKKIVELKNIKKAINNEEIEPQHIRSLIYNIYGDEDGEFIEKIETKDKEIKNLFQSRLKEKMLKKVEKDTKEYGTKLLVEYGRLSSFKKMKNELSKI